MYLDIDEILNLDKRCKLYQTNRGGKFRLVTSDKIYYLYRQQFALLSKVSFHFWLSYKVGYGLGIPVQECVYDCDFLPDKDCAELLAKWKEFLADEYELFNHAPSELVTYGNGGTVTQFALRDIPYLFPNSLVLTKGVNDFYGLTRTSNIIGNPACYRI